MLPSELLHFGGDEDDDDHQLVEDAEEDALGCERNRQKKTWLINYNYLETTID